MRAPLALILGLPFAACSSFRQLPPERILAEAEQHLRPWAETWAPMGKPASGPDAEAAEEALERLLYLESQHADKVDRERLSFRKAQALFATGELGKASASLRTHLENYPLTAHRTEAERAIFQIAAGWALSGGSFLGTGLFSEEGRAVDALNYLIDNAPRSPYAVDSLRLLGEIRFRSRDYSDSIATFERILQGYPESIWGDLAQFRVALAFLRRVQDPRRDREALLQAGLRLREYLERRREGSFRRQAEEALAEAEEKLAESEFEIGEFYRRIGKTAGARYHFTETMKKYPKSRLAAEAADQASKLPSEAPPPPGGR